MCGNMEDYFVCPHCGAELPVKSKFCSECGSDESTGWGEDGSEEEFEFSSDDYEELLSKEFGERSFDKKALIKKIIIASIAAILGAAMLVGGLL
jgi:hypothetical protein